LLKARVYQQEYKQRKKLSQIYAQASGLLDAA
jgi:hypothetical protein